MRFDPGAASATVPPAASIANPVSTAARPQRRSLKQLAVRGSVWTVGGYGLQQVLRLGANLVLTRLLFPEAFGLMALVGAFMQGLAMFSDIGIGPAIIQGRRGSDPDFLNTAWTIQILRGFLLWLATCLLAWPVAAFYGEPILVGLLSAAGLSALIAGFTSTRLFIANRRLWLGRLATLELLSQAVSIVCMIALALAMRSVWALVLGNLVAVATKTAASYFLLSGPVNRLRWEAESRRELLRFGRWIFVSTLLAFWAMQADRLILGKLVTLEVLGVYSIALTFTAAAGQVFERLSRSVLMPALADVARRAPGRFRKSLLAGRRALLSGGVLGCGAAVLLAPLFFQSLYDPRYHQAGWMAQLLTISLWISLLQRTSRAGLLALGCTAPLAGGNAVNLLVTLIAAPLGFSLGGLPGFILGWSFGNLAGLAVIQTSLRRRNSDTTGQDLAFTFALAALIGAGLGLQWFAQVSSAPNVTRWWTEGLPSIAVLAAAAAAVLLGTRKAVCLPTVEHDTGAG